MGELKDITLSPMGRGKGEGDATFPVLARNFIARARELRTKQTEAEQRLWSRLRGRRLGGWKFKRQVPIGRFIADFLCSDAWLIVELDGGHHNNDDVAARDRNRTIELESKHYVVLRFWNHEVMHELDSVCETVLNMLQGAPAHVR